MNARGLENLVPRGEDSRRVVQAARSLVSCDDSVSGTVGPPRYVWPQQATLRRAAGMRGAQRRGWLPGTIEAGRPQAELKVRIVRDYRVPSRYLTRRDCTENITVSATQEKGVALIRD